MSRYNRRRLVHLTPPTQWNATIHIGFVDYTGHRAKGGGCHYTAVHELRVTEDELYEILKPHLEEGPGNTPDMTACDSCGEVHSSDELKFNADDFSYSCSNCVVEEQAI